MRVSVRPQIRAGISPTGTTSTEAEFTEWVGFRSSNVAQARYRASDAVLDVQFHDGAMYRYEHVSPDKWEAFVRSPSPGRFVHGQLKQQHRVSRIG